MSSIDPTELAAGFAAAWGAHAGAGRLLAGRVTGSRMYGTARPDSDWDWAGVFVAPTERLLGLAPPAETISDNRGAGTDWTFHEARKFLLVLGGANANTLEALFAPADAVVPGDPTLAPFWAELVGHRRAFLTQKVLRHYLAYARSQLAQVRGEPVRESRKRPNKPVDRWKDAGHGVRLLYNALEIARGGEPVIRLEGERRGSVLAVRHGEISAVMVESVAADLGRQIDALRPWPLPEDGPTAFLEDWLLRLRRFDLGYGGGRAAPLAATDDRLRREAGGAPRD